MFYTRATTPPLPTKPPPQSGFALVIALSLMAFVLLLLLSITTLVQVETRTAEISKSQIAARKNALAAAQLALGELQKYAGPDQRITARSDILNPTGTTPAQAGERFWTGVWDVEPTALKNGNATRVLPGQPFKHIKERGVARWLVSNPTPAVDLDPANYTLIANDSVTLYKDPVPTATDSSVDDQSVRVNLVDIKGKQGQVTGKYAWWVSDEGVKASIGLADAHGTSDEAKEKALLSIQRTAPELLNAGNESLEKLPSSTAYSKIADLQHFSLIIDDVVTNGVETQKDLFHDVTVNHQGLPVDVRQGGFKKDLTHILGDSTQFADFIKNDNQGDLVFGGVGEVLSPTKSDIYDLTTAFSPKDTKIGQAKDSTSLGSPGYQDPGGPSWQQIQRFYNSHTQVTKSGAMVSPLNDEISNAYGIYPVITHFQLHFHPMLISDGYDMETEKHTLRPRLIILPAIRIWNPYNVALEAQKYYFALTRRKTDSHDFKYNIEFDGDGDGDIDASNTNFDYNNTNASKGEKHRKIDGNETNLQQFRFYVNDLIIGPGQSIVLALKETAPRDLANFKSGTELVAGMPDNKIHYQYNDGSTFSRQIKKNIDPSSGTELSSIVHMTLNIVEMQNVSLVFGIDGWEGNGGNNLIKTPLQYLSKFLNKDGGTIETSNWPNGPSVISGNQTYNKIARIPRSLSTNEIQADPGNLDLISLKNSGRIGDINKFPSTGFYAHLRTVDNYVDADLTSNTRFRVLTMAHNNPRAPRHGVRTMGGTGVDPGGKNNHLFYVEKDHYFERLPSINVYNFFSQNIPDDDGVVGFGFSDDGIYQGKWTAFELPNDESYFTSISSLMHANLEPSGTQFFKDWINENSNRFSNSSNASGWNPALPIGNSMSSHYVGSGTIFRHSWPKPKKESDPPSGHLYDWSYLLNDTLWDRYFFSSYITQNGHSLRELNNSRYTFDETLKEDLKGANYTTENQVKKDYRAIASRLLVNGAFNINSTSIEAWKAFLGGMLGVEVNDTLNVDRAPFPRMTNPISEAVDAFKTNAAIDTEASYTGYSSLTAADIDHLATGIVNEVRLRGPFVSLSHFVNRTVGGHVISNQNLPFAMGTDNLGIFETQKEDTAAKDLIKAGLTPYIYRKGPLQAAIDGAGSSQIGTTYNLNTHSYADPDYVISHSEYEKINSKIANERDFDGLVGQSMASSFSSYLTQGDLLARIGSSITPRSDTFKVRSYGDVRDPISKNVSAKAWCELTVRRTANYVDHKSNHSFDSGRNQDTSISQKPLNRENQAFGRKFKIVSMRWLSENEI